ncbi:hypothetical protein BaRGS_00031406, partial [Batillaria attramentaria]
LRAYEVRGELLKACHHDARWSPPQDPWPNKATVGPNRGLVATGKTIQSLAAAAFETANFLLTPRSLCVNYLELGGFAVNSVFVEVEAPHYPDKTPREPVEFRRCRDISGEELWTTLCWRTLEGACELDSGLRHLAFNSPQLHALPARRRTDKQIETEGRHQLHAGKIEKLGKQAVQMGGMAVLQAPSRLQKPSPGKVKSTRPRENGRLSIKRVPHLSCGVTRRRE